MRRQMYVGVNSGRTRVTAALCATMSVAVAASAPAWLSSIATNLWPRYRMPVPS